MQICHTKKFETTLNPELTEHALPKARSRKSIWHGCSNKVATWRSMILCRRFFTGSNGQIQFNELKLDRSLLRSRG